MVSLQPLDTDDRLWLRNAIAHHVDWTGSAVGASILADWPRRSALFTKVMPTDYERVLRASRLARAEGRDVDAAIMEAARG
jgi:glutamate synthase (NADPH/NADH) large chain